MAETDLIDLSIPTLMAACKGNVKLLPSFMVHGNAVWPTGRIQLDNRNRIHLRRATFLAAVTVQVPVRPGIWHSLDVQEFHIDLQPHHLQGSADMAPAKGHQHSRAITKTDAAGRNPGDEDYGETVREPVRFEERDLDAARAALGGQLRGVGSAALGDAGGE